MNERSSVERYFGGGSVVISRGEAVIGGSWWLALCENTRLWHSWPSEVAQSKLESVGVTVGVLVKNDVLLCGCI